MKIVALGSFGLSFARSAGISSYGAGVNAGRMQNCSADSFVKQRTAQYCGNTEIRDRITQKPVEVDFFKTTFQQGSSEIYSMCEKNGTIIGNMTLTIDKNAVFVANLESFHRKKYSGVGSAFMQLAVEKSMQHPSKPPIRLNARKLHIFQRSPVGFYKKLGFIQDKNVKESDVEHFGTPMSLQPGCFESWLEKIRKKPILANV